MTSQWWQYRDVGTYPGVVAVTLSGFGASASVTVPSDATSGQTIVLILEVNTTNSPSMTHYQRVELRVQ
jgi:hypothetical protein